MALAAGVAYGLGAGVAHAQYSVSAPVILQDFNSSYLSIENKMPDIFQSGYGAVYLPPPGYSTTSESVGYDVYNRFDLGTAAQPTTYGTQNEFEAAVQGIHSFGAKAYIDLLWNDSGSMNSNTPGFAASGGYPGLAVTLQDTNPNAPGYNTLGYNETGTAGGPSYVDPANGQTYYYQGDYHDDNPNSSGYEPANGTDGTVAGLDDIAQEENNVLIRQPTTAGNPLNIPAGTTPWNGYLANIPTPTNAQYYPDLSMTPKTVYDAALNQTFTVYPYNTTDPMAGTAVAENSTGYLMRYTQWMIQDMGVDGFRIDAAYNMPTWVLNYYDAAVYDESNRYLLNGQQEQIYGYSEVYFQNAQTTEQYINLSDTNNGAGNTIEGDRDAMDFPLYQAMYNNLNAFNGTYGNSSGNNWYNVVTSSLDYADDGILNGSEGVKFVNDQDGGAPAPGLVQVAYAYMLMLPGQAEVYYNGENFNNESGSGSSGYFPEGGASDPKDGDLGALGGVFDTNVQNSAYSNTAITTLVDIRNRYGRGNYREDWIETNLLAYERTGSAIVLVDNATTVDTSLPKGVDYETRTMSVSFAPGTWLEELTGNATSSYSDPNGEISQFLQVQSGGVISGGGLLTARFLGNAVYAKGSNTTVTSTNDGYLIYGLPTPTGNLSMTNVASVMASQTGQSTTPGGWEPNANYSNGVDRNSTVNVVTASSFQLNLSTNAAYLQVTPTTQYYDQAADGDNAQFTIDGGSITVAPTGLTSTTPGSNGEDTNPNDVSYGYQNFASSSPGYYNANGNGAYSQTIDTADLSIGYHYIEVISFRHAASSSAPPVYSDWYDTIYVDRGTPQSSIQSFAPFASAPSDYTSRQLDIQSDGTTNSEYVYLNLPVGITNSQILSMIGTGDNTINGVTYNGGSAGQTDQNIFAYGFSDLQNGNNVATVVSYRPDGNYSIQRFTASDVSDLGDATANGLGLGDLNADGHINTTDVYDFYNDVLSNGQAFNPAADMNGTGLNDVNDWLLFDAELQQNNTLNSSSPNYVSSSTISYFNALSPNVSLTLPTETSYNLQVPVAAAVLGALSMSSGAMLNVAGTGSGPNTPYSVTFGATSINGNVTFDVSNNGAGAGTLNLGALSDRGVASSMVFGGNGTVNLNASGSLLSATMAGIAAGATVNVNVNGALGTNGISIDNAGLLAVNGNQILGTVSGTGSVMVGNGVTANILKFAADTTGISMAALTINGNSALDINNNHLFINFGTNPDPIATIRQYLVNGYNGGAWNGPGGINSSAANSNYGVGYADGSDSIVPNLLPGTIELAFTLYGDANLDGVVNSIDFGILAANFGKSGKVWDGGDFNYDGVVNSIDFGLMAANFGKSASGADIALPSSDWTALDTFAAANGLLAYVPEPAAGSLFALNLSALLLRRRRNAKQSRHRQNADRSASILGSHQ
ncbi:MAG TPA: dockerin type I domain-containing protein [Tepidisphaeraceae bacterium]|nr:dockerin type I domain-containing protein [Tepidisphaeraceae bacterium]